MHQAVKLIPINLIINFSYSNNQFEMRFQSSFKTKFDKMYIETQIYDSSLFFSCFVN